MMKSKGFTLIEVMVVIVIVCIVGAMAIPMLFGINTNSNSTMSYGINGITESRCIDGYKFIVGRHGFSQQVIGPNGGGVQCNGL